LARTALVIVYFESKCASKDGKRKRWVMYNGLARLQKCHLNGMAGCINTFDAPLGEKKYPWQKNILPNLTGTDLAYMPPGL